MFLTLILTDIPENTSKFVTKFFSFLYKGHIPNKT
jgi:hypothetical protein